MSDTPHGAIEQVARKDGYHVPDEMIGVSIAISLKRIADTLDKIESALRFQAEQIYSARR